MRFVTSKALVFFVAILLCGLVAFYAVRNPDIQQPFLGQLKHAALLHIGHVRTEGRTYKVLDQRFYHDDETPDITLMTMTLEEALRFTARAAGSFVLVPLPWQAQTRSELAFIPQQMFWYVLVALALVGCCAGFWRDRLLTCILAAIICVSAAAVALSTGNVGTLVRLRDMVLPLVVWLSSLGACILLERTAVHNRERVNTEALIAER